MKLIGIITISIIFGLLAAYVTHILPIKSWDKGYITGIVFIGTYGILNDIFNK